MPSHIGLVFPGVRGHLNPMGALGRELMLRGHRVTSFGVVDTQQAVENEGLDFCPIGAARFPKGSLPEITKELSRLHGIRATLRTLNAFEHITAVMCGDARAAMESAGLDTVIVDQVLPAGATAAESLGIPYVTVCTGLPIHSEPGFPPFWTAWDYRTDWWATARNRAGQALFDGLTAKHRSLINRWRKEWRLRPIRCWNELSSSYACISQMLQELDFERTAIPESFHYTGLLRNRPVESTKSTFPYHLLDGRPLVYASLGTMNNGIAEIFFRIAEACAGLNAQLVISMGGRDSGSHLTGLPGSPIVVEYAPQLELIARASACITHAGLNTVLECLSEGLPMVAIPIANDQPGIAARLAHSGAGELVALSRLNPYRLRSAIDRVLFCDTYKSSAKRLQAAMREAGGVRRAADITEQVLRTGRPATRSD